jgi:hypothetical protein
MRTGRYPCALKVRNELSDQHQDLEVPEGPEKS